MHIKPFHKSLFALMVITVLTSISILSVNAESAYILDSDFDNGSLQGWTVYAFGNNSAMVSGLRFHSKPYSMLIYDEDVEESVWISQEFIHLENSTYYLDVSVFIFEQSEGSVTYSPVTIRVVGDTGYAVIVSFKPLGYIYEGDTLYTFPNHIGCFDNSGFWKPIQAYTNNTWYNFHIEIDIDTKTYDITINNALKASDVTWYEEGSDYIYRLDIGSIDDVSTSRAFIDDIGLYSVSSVPLVLTVLPLIISVASPGIIVGGVGFAFSRIGDILGGHNVAGFLIGGFIALVISTNGGLIPMWFLISVVLLSGIAVYLWFKGG